MTLNVQPVDRFTWERIVMRARFDRVISGSGRVSESTGKPTRGGVSGAAFKAIALVFAAHSDKDGADVRPGDMRVAILAESNPKTVKAVREKLIELGLMRQAGRWRHTPMYRLTLPEDLTDLVVVLSPAQVVETAKSMRASARASKASSRNGGSGGPPNGGGKGTPEDHPNGDGDGGNGWSSGPPESANGWSSGPDMGGPLDPLNHVRTGQEDHQGDTGVDLGTAVTGPSEPRPAKCTHGLSGGLRSDGQPKCAICRRQQRAGPGDPEPPPIAPVIDLDSRRTA